MVTSAVPTRPLTTNRLAVELRELIDVVSDPLASTRRPFDYASAFSSLLVLLSDPMTWEKIWVVKDGSKGNKVLSRLGSHRAAWLRRFYDEVVSR